MQTRFLSSLAAALLVSVAALAQGVPPQKSDPVARHGDMCRDIVAGETGRMAALEVRLNLSAPQKPLFARWSKVKLDAAQAEAAACAADAPPPPPDEKAAPPSPDPVKMLAGEEKRLTARLAALKAEIPALKALAASLSDEQKRALTPPHHPGHGPMGGPGMGPAMGQAMGMRQGGKGPGPQGPDAPPPAP